MVGVRRLVEGVGELLKELEDLLEELHARNHWWARMEWKNSALMMYDVPQTRKL